MRIDIDHLTLPEPESVSLLKAEVRRLRAAIAALADQDATLAICNGNVTVTMDATLTDAEREAVAWTIDLGEGNVYDIQNFQWEAEAIAAALLKNEGVIAKAVPLYRHTQPTLTDDEREAIECGIQAIGLAPRDERTLAYADRLRGLLERAK